MVRPIKLVAGHLILRFSVWKDKKIQMLIIGASNILHANVTSVLLLVHHAKRTASGATTMSHIIGVATA